MIRQSLPRVGRYGDDLPRELEQRDRYLDARDRAPLWPFVWHDLEQTITAETTLRAWHAYVLAGTFTVRLPDPRPNDVVLLKMGAAGTVTLAPVSSTVTVDGASSYALTTSGAAVIVIGRSRTRWEVLPCPVGGSGGTVPTTRTLTAGAGLTGGGDLSADRTFTVVAADGTITVNPDSIQVGTIQTGNIAADAVTFAKLQNIATDRLLGRDTAASGDPEELTVGGGVEFTGAGGIQRSALTGDVTAAAGSGSTTIANDAVTYAKMQNVSAASRLLGRGSGAGAGDPEEIAIGSGLSMSGTTLTSSGITPRRVVGVTFDGGGSAPTVGTVGYLVAPFNGTIDQWHIVADASGSAVVDVWKAAGTIPTNANSIAGSEKPTLSAAQLGSDTSLTTWTTTTVTAGDVFGFEIESVTTCTRLTVEVRISEAA